MFDIEVTKDQIESEVRKTETQEVLSLIFFDMLKKTARVFKSQSPKKVSKTVSNKSGWVWKKK